LKILAKNVLQIDTNFAYIRVSKAGYETHIHRIECNLIRTETQTTVLWF